MDRIMGIPFKGSITVLSREAQSTICGSPGFSDHPNRGSFDSTQLGNSKGGFRYH
jgi:hypothetical protein